MWGSWRTSTAVIAAVVTAAAAGTGGAAGAAEPAWDGPHPLTVEPASGPVGTRVTVSGGGCAVPGQELVLVFAGGGGAGRGGGTEGAADHPGGTITPDADDRFTVEFPIPPTLHEFRGSGGGAVVPGTYWFQTVPPGCTGSFTVTPTPPPAGSSGAAPVRAQPRYTG